VVVSKRFCMIRWLPRWRSAANPFCSRMPEISEPERTQSLPNRNLNLGHEDLVVRAPGHFGRGRRLEEQRDRLDEVGSRLFNRSTLAGNVEVRTQRYKAVVLTFDDRGQGLRWLQNPSLHQFKRMKSRLPFLVSGRLDIKIRKRSEG